MGTAVFGGMAGQELDEAALREVLMSVRKLTEQVREYEQSFLAVTFKPPPKPREGMVRLADGTKWNPGAGRGYYAYISAAWTKL